MNKNKALKIQLSIILFIIILVAVYFSIGIYYHNSFVLGTYVNGVYCTGKSIEEVNTELVSKFDEKELTLLDVEGRQYKISLSDIAYKMDYHGQLDALIHKQNPILWIQRFTRTSNQEINPVILFDKEKLIAAISTCGIIQENQKENIVEIRKNEGYVLYDGMKNVLDSEKVISCIEKQLYLSQTSIDVSQCYSDLPYTWQMKNTFSLWEKVDDFQNCDIIYDMGDEQVQLTPEIVSKWITLDVNGDFLLDENKNLILNEEAVASFIDTLCQTYDTYGKNRIFSATRGEDIEIEGGTYGNKLDRDKEINYLLEAFRKNEKVIHVPFYEKQAFVRGKNDIGDTYVEIDMGLQKLYYYEKGELLFESDIVTGNTGRKMGSPSGVFFVYNKQKNRTLRGVGYEAFVKYWVAVKGSIGIHDASWRDKFGGEIYKTNGSHGCINVPRDKMTDLYDLLEVGVPVVMFY